LSILPFKAMLRDIGLFFKASAGRSAHLVKYFALTGPSDPKPINRAAVQAGRRGTMAIGLKV
jgi:hypothetical protein